MAKLLQSRPQISIKLYREVGPRKKKVRKTEFLIDGIDGYIDVSLSNRLVLGDMRLRSQLKSIPANAPGLGGCVNRAVWKDYIVRIRGLKEANRIEKFCDLRKDIVFSQSGVEYDNRERAAEWGEVIISVKKFMKIFNSP
jgi:hypothetical protein